MLFHKRFIKQCIKNHSKELEHGARMVMKAQKLEEEKNYEKAIKYYEMAKKMFSEAEMFASFFGDKAYQLEAKVLIKKVDEQMNNVIVKDFYRSGIDH